MADVNAPPITPPREWLDNPKLSKGVQELYFFIFQLWKRSGGGIDFIENNTGNIADNLLRIEENAAGWPSIDYTPDDFQGSFLESVQSSNYTTTQNEIIKLSADVPVTLNATPSDKERVYIKSATGKGFNVLSTKKIDGQANRRYNNPYSGYWFSYSIELDTWSIL